MAWDWDHLSRNAGTPIGDELARLDQSGELHRPAPSPRRWTRSEVGIALLVAAVLAATVLLAALTPAAHR